MSGLNISGGVSFGTFFSMAALDDWMELVHFDDWLQRLTGVAALVLILINIYMKIKKVKDGKDTASS